MTIHRGIEERAQVKADNLRKQSTDQLKRIIKDMRLTIAQSYGPLAIRANIQKMAVVTTRVDSRNNFRRKVIARCLTILRERGIKDDD